MLSVLSVLSALSALSGSGSGGLADGCDRDCGGSGVVSIARKAIPATSIR
ncbi:hypothetical protein ABZ554_21480 [Streptomyces sp. NPDC020125]